MQPAKRACSAHCKHFKLQCAVTVTVRHIHAFFEEEHVVAAQLHLNWHYFLLLWAAMSSCNEIREVEMNETHSSQF